MDETCTAEFEGNPTLLCHRPRGHMNLHFDESLGVWWLGKQEWTDFVHPVIPAGMVPDEAPA